MYYALRDRGRDDAESYGLSCDEEGVFLAGCIPIVTRNPNLTGRTVYKSRPVSEIGWLLAKAYGSKVDFSNQIDGFERIAGYMTDGKWVLAKIAAVQLRLPDLPNNGALSKAIAAEMHLAKCHCQNGRKAGKRDVSDEPRVPAGQSNGGQWTTTSGTASGQFNSLLVPAQTIIIPVPPLELPIPSWPTLPP